jgi:hypothetical protein
VKNAQLYKYSQEFFAVRNEEVQQICSDFEPNAIDTDYVYWLNFHNLHDRQALELLCQKLQLDKLSIESIFLPLRRSKVEEYSNYLFFQIHTLRNNSATAAETEKLSFVVGKSFLLSFQDHQGLHFSDVRERIEKSKGKIICGYGASTKGNTLLQYFGLDNTLIDAIAERSPYKFGHKTIGTNIPILSENDVRKMKPDYMLVLPWHFKESILAREEEFTSKGGKFIFPLPEIEIV